MKNPIVKQGMFATPDDWKRIETMIEGLPRKDRIHGYTIAYMTWNYASQVVDDAMVENAQGKKDSEA